MAFITSTAAAVFGTSNADEIDTRNLNGSFSTIYGGLGNDFYFIDAFFDDVTDTPADVVVEALGAGLDTIRLNMVGLGALGNANFTLYDNVENLEASLSTSNIDSFTLTGNNLANKISITNSTMLTSAFLNGLAGNDTLIGGFANDALDGGTGIDSMVGGDGSDTYHVDNVLDTVIENSNLGSGLDTVNSNVSFTLGANVERLALNYGAGNINGTGNALDNRMYGSSGNNTLNGMAGDDTLRGLDGNDILNGGDGSDSLYGNNGNDILNGGDGIDYLHGGSGSDLLNGGDGIDNLRGNDGNDILNGGNGDDHLYGSNGNDTLNGGAGNDRLYGSNDGSGNIDKLDGGAGDDFYKLYSANDVVADTGVGGNDTVMAYSQLNGDLGASIENLGLSIYGNAISGRGNALNNLITGNNYNNILFGLAGNDSLNGGDGLDSLEGGDGNDTLNGGAGNDLMRGGIGNDVYLVDSTNDLVIENIGGGFDAVLSEVDFTLGTHVENLTLAGAAYNGFGNSLDNLITGNSNSNNLIGNDGKDTLDGGAGADYLAGGNGADTYLVDNSSDYIDEVTGVTDSSIDAVRASVNFNLTNQSSGDVEILTLTGTNNISGYGNGIANTITGNDGNNYLEGNGGKDTLFGGLGNDYLAGGAGVDSMVGGAGDDYLDGGLGVDSMVGGLGDDDYIVDITGDIVTELAGQGTDTVRSAISFSLAALGNVENLYIYGAATSGTGNALNNFIGGSGNAELLNGLAGNDTLNGYGGADTLNGGDGNDTLDGGAGDDSMTGGLGNDTYVVDSTLDIVIEATLSGTDTVFSSGVAFTLGTNVENLTLSGTAYNGFGNSLDNLITGNSNSNNLIGNDGKDTLDGGAGADYLAGGNGADTYLVDNSSDYIDEASGVTDSSIDTVRTTVNFNLINQSSGNIENLKLTGTNNIAGYGNSIANTITGNDGDNFIAGNGGNDTLFGGLGDDNFNGGTGADSIVGGAGDDSLYGDTGADTMVGGLGDDYYYIDVAGDIVTELAGQGTDTVQSKITYTLGANVENLYIYGAAISGTGNALNNFIGGSGNAEVMNGLAGNDTLNGYGGADALNGGDGNDTLDGGANSITAGDTLVGGLGNDTYTIDSALDVVTELAAAGNDTLISSLAALINLSAGTFANIENAELTNAGNFNIIGNAAANKLTGGAGNNNLDGGANNDTLFGGLGLDTLFGGAGNDSLDGGDGVDSLNGGDGSDTLNGGTGLDSMTGGAGNDVYIVNQFNDIVIESVGGGTDLVKSSSNFFLSSNVENLTLTGTGGHFGYGNATANIIKGNSGSDRLYGYGGNDMLIGGLGDDNLIGDIGADSLVGGAGDDYLDGGLGVDSMVGGAGDDFYEVDVAGDIVIELAGQGIDTIESTFNFSLAALGNVENLFLGTGAINGTGNALNNRIIGNGNNNTLNGAAGNDALYGSAGADILNGGLGNDKLEGGAGNDSLTGGAGDDVFMYFNGDGTDTITDFVSGFDSLDLSGLAGLMFNGGGASLTASQFQLGTAANDVNDRIIYNQTTGDLFYDADGSGAIVQQHIINFTGVAPALSSADIFA